jgi:flavin-dependent dehydrogenase
VVERECRTVEVRLPGSGRTIVCRRDTPLVTMTTRAYLDLLLANRAAEAGVVVRAPCAARAVEATPTGATVTTDDGALHCALVVAADGATGTVSRAGFGAVRHAAPALELELPASGRILERFGDRARFDFGVVAGGYGWVFPKRTTCRSVCCPPGAARRIWVGPSPLTGMRWGSVVATPAHGDMSSPSGLRGAPGSASG